MFISPIDAQRVLRLVRPTGLLAILLSIGALHPAQAQQPPTESQSVESQSVDDVPRPTLRIGSQGEAVSEVQALLKLLGYYASPVDGVYRATTAAAVSAFQTAVGLPADGVMGTATWDRLLPAAPPPVVAESAPPAAPAQPTAASPAETTPESESAPIALPVLRLGMRGSAVVQLQERLRVLGFFNGAIDGVFGAETQAAVEAVQRNYQIDPDGVVGPATWTALLSKP